MKIDKNEIHATKETSPLLNREQKRNLTKELKQERAKNKRIEEFKRRGFIK